MTQEEKVLILGALFHDIGKFEQRCTGNPQKIDHESLGYRLVTSSRFRQRFEKIIGAENFNVFTNLIVEHHNPAAQGLTATARVADHLSASERVEKEKAEEFSSVWGHKHLCSLFSKVRLLSDEPVSKRYFKHSVLSKQNHRTIIPQEMTVDEIKENVNAYKEFDFEEFQNNLESVLDFYKDENDFTSLINLLLIVFEKYLWCIPDFTGSEFTDISLFNHIKDVAGLSHSIYLTKKDNPQSNMLNLIIGDIPGIQSYIFDVVNKKPAKILRGRSIFVQILTRNFATKFLEMLGLTEVNLVMLAGGKFYIIAPDTKDFKEKYDKIIDEIEEYLFENFRFDLSLNAAFFPFDYNDLKGKKKTFGQLVEEASFKLLESKHKLFSKRMFKGNTIDYKNYIWEEEYITSNGIDTDNIKCAVTDKPIRKEREANIKDPTDNGFDIIKVDSQVATEYEIGRKVTENNVVICLAANGLDINPKEIYKIKDFNKKNDESIKKVLLNPTLDDLLNPENRKKDIFSNSYYLEVANYCSSNSNGEVLSFDEMSEENTGAEYLTLIKGDIDNLGLIMAYGLTDNDNDLTAISRTTTLSNHLKYYFSFFLNGFLKGWENRSPDNKVYTIFAGGDDLMLVTPQSSAIKLIKALNDEFDEFSCSNIEVHISYSITHFKHHTPIRIVSEFAEQNQTQGKKQTKKAQQTLIKSKNKNAFDYKTDKAGTYLFDTFLKNTDLDFLIKKVSELEEKTKDGQNGLSHGLIRKLLEVSEMLRKYNETDDASYLIAYARLNYAVNRILKEKDKNTRQFFDKVLMINKEGDAEAQQIEKVLHPLVCQVIYNIR